MKTPNSQPQQSTGFALVVTISLLVLVSVLGVSLLSLSAVTVRSASRGSAQMQARANARIALQLAIGELQRQAGADTRVTASADILDADGATPSNLAVTGVWKSWEGSDHGAPGTAVTGEAHARPKAPAYDTKRRSEDSSDGKFLSWLISKPQGVNDADLISEDPNWSVGTALEDIVRNAPFVDPVDSSKVSVPLVFTGSLAAGDPRQVHVMPLPISSGASQRGAYAWWVSGENQKARLPVPYQPAATDAVGWSKLAKSHATADPSALHLDAVLAADGPAKAAKVSSLGMSSLLVPNDPLNPNAADPAKLFHDMSASSVGLLTNTATGGWRKDLSLFTENWNLLPASGVEVFRITPDASSSALATMTRPTNATMASVMSQGSIFYPWSENRKPNNNRGGLGRPYNYPGAVSSWHNLMSYATLYKQLTLPGGKPTIAARTAIANGGVVNSTSEVTDPINHFNYLHNVRVMPVLGRLQLVYSYRSVPSPTAGKFRVEIGVTPVGTIWNPYNVALEPIHISHMFPRSLPPAFRFKIGTKYKADEIYFVHGDHNDGKNYNKPTNRTDGVWRMLYMGPLLGSIVMRNGIVVTAQNSAYNPRSLDPGETMVFNGKGSAGYVPGNASGYTYYGGNNDYPNAQNYHRTLAINVGTTATPNWFGDGTDANDYFAGSDVIMVDARFNSYSSASSTNGVVGCFYEMRDFSNRHDGPHYSRTEISYDKPTADRLWPSLDNAGSIVDPRLPPPPPPIFPRIRVDQATGAGIPFLSLLYGSRSTSTSGRVSTHSLTSKGFQQSSPFMFNIDAGEDMRNGVGGPTGQEYVGGVLGASHPVNTAMDFQFLTHSTWNDSTLPNCSTDGKNNGYLVSGTQSGDGLRRIAVAELPLRPLGSLAELQHWDLRMDNPAPPHQFNIIANSDAQPLFSPDAVIRNGVGIPYAAPNPSIDVQHDDSYCANHLLFDDWFFSTIAPQPTTFGPVGKTLQETFTAFVRDGAPLDNRAYRPILEDSGVSEAQATTLFNTKVNASESYRSIAARLEVEGMFNVNSTSVTAWRALLGHARNQRVPYYDGNGNMVLSAPTDYATARTTVAGDVAAGPNGSFAGASEYSGYRVFTDAMIDQMAEEMVRQVRLRGPFLSLSEFVNRRLANNTYDNLALAGAVQSALNVLAANADDAANPYSVLQDESPNAGLSVLNDAGKGAGSGFDSFPEASEGESVYGLPGWPRQADILRPLAPILTARDDTFTIRAYGDARDADGQITARATCEAVVRRGRDFVSPGEDAADITDPPTAAANQQFGRRFQIVSFRWLHADEI